MQKRNNDRSANTRSLAPDTLRFGHSRARKELTSAAHNRSGPSPSGALPPGQKQPRGRLIRIMHRVLQESALDRQILAVLLKQLLQRTFRGQRDRHRRDPDLAQILKRQHHARRRAPRHQPCPRRDRDELAPPPASDHPTEPLPPQPTAELIELTQPSATAEGETPRPATTQTPPQTAPTAPTLGTHTLLLIVASCRITTANP